VLAASLSVEGIFSDRVQLKESIVKGVDEELARFGTTVSVRLACAACVLRASASCRACSPLWCSSLISSPTPLPVPLPFLAPSRFRRCGRPT
jgi:hypothetical protein